MVKIKNWFKNNWLLSVSVTVAIVLYAFDRGPLHRYIGYHDVKVLLVLFTMMLISGGLERSGVLRWLSYVFMDRAHGTFQATAMLIIITAVFSAFVTNDIALMVMVPFTIRVFLSLELSPMWPVIFVTIAANVGSSLTPFGNPQNIYIYAYYGLDFSQFISAIWPFTVFGIFLLLVSAYMFVDKKSLSIKGRVSIQPWAIWYVLSLPIFLYGVLLDNVFVLTILAVILGIYSLWHQDVWADVDFSLLLVFVSFFFISGSITHMYNPEPLTSSKSVFLLSAFLSQVISNVPTATILADITPLWKPLLIGVSVGGVGTLIASMANLISYNIYVRRVGKDRYLWYFHVYSFGFLAILIAFMWFFV